ncbi:MAG: hypothetical protein SCALA702_07460 [Melioribacteraceae bacterium]|nr:MAG: hypothetical protein SCALA702_07460 [Melioribacteraceae bacterium]
MEGAVVFIFLLMIVGISFIIHTYLRSKERRMMIERGMNAEDIIALYKKPKIRSDWFYRIGIVAVIFGVFLAIALTIESWTSQEEFIGPLIIIGLGIGFIAAHKISEMEDAKKKSAAEEEDQIKY